MANFETKSEFTELLRMLETTDPAHADIFNNIIGALLNNDIFLRAVANQLLQQMQQHISDSQSTLDVYYQQSSGYTDQKIADLINGAPSTLDTLGEIAQAMKNNESVVTALDEAIGKKASAAEFDSHVKDNSVHVKNGVADDSKKWSGKSPVFLSENAFQNLTTKDSDTIYFRYKG